MIPSSLQTVYQNREADAIGEEERNMEESFKRKLSGVSIGEAGYPVWGENFKIRVTSNNTGRKIDFNVVFNLIKKKTPEEIK